MQVASPALVHREAPAALVGVSLAFSTVSDRIESKKGIYWKEIEQCTRSVGRLEEQTWDYRKQGSGQQPGPVPARSGLPSFSPSAPMVLPLSENVPAAPTLRTPGCVCDLLASPHAHTTWARMRESDPFSFS